jgi:hypothetical protein
LSIWTYGLDESSDQNPKRNFLFGGFAGPSSDWDGAFADAWRERVLDGPPSIPYLHTTDIRSSQWRLLHGLSHSDAEKRLDEATRVIRSMGSLIPVVVYVDEAAYARTLQPFEIQDANNEKLKPDYMLFLYCVFVQLHKIHDRYPDATKVDFHVENNGSITEIAERFHGSLESTIRQMGHPEVADMVGEFKAVDKSSIPAQVADVILWHVRRAKSETLDSDGKRRYARMIDGGGGRNRYGYLAEMDQEFLKSFAKKFAEIEARQASAAPNSVQSATPTGP